MLTWALAWTLGAAGVAAAILAGGQARRMGGVAKALLEVEGRPIVARLIDEHEIDAVAHFAAKIVVPESASKAYTESCSVTAISMLCVPLPGTAPFEAL